ncbi:C39 family peptidase [Micromonospora endolithica]|uniref:Phytochelatin synthase n=1 Tax=Micromonospora endolithica TaxID=230091 RepID=A0A3A9ZQ31_9ACTN|nr:C39 family peptidase [Micromonospora endolithica]RKN50360.1 phytochelatin synthase [Micromonospora endolithica]TWJ20970.1 peptidase C39-like protein [Micromonospora endolithica]
MNSIVRTSVASIAGLMIAGGGVAGPAMAVQAGPMESRPAVAVPPEQSAEDKRLLEHDYERQPNAYYCAPAATSIALSTQGKDPSQKEVAKKLGTTEAGTNSVNDTTRVLNEMTGGGYETTEIKGTTAKPEQVEKLRTDVTEAVDAKRGVVVNTIGTGVDTDGDAHVFPGGHYVTVVGYRDGSEEMKIADPYDPKKYYWIDDEELADWTAERGYSS